MPRAGSAHWEPGDPSASWQALHTERDFVLRLDLTRAILSLPATVSTLPALNDSVHKKRQPHVMHRRLRVEGGRRGCSLQPMTNHSFLSRLRNRSPAMLRFLWRTAS